MNVKTICFRIFKALRLKTKMPPNFKIANRSGILHSKTKQEVETIQQVPVRNRTELCATALNGYDKMMVGVEKSLGHKRPLLAAHARFKIARTEADCVFPNSADIDWRYVGPIIGLAVLGFINFAWLFRIAGVQA